jgi:hypothetical protein
MDKISVAILPGRYNVATAGTANENIQISAAEVAARSP